MIRADSLERRKRDKNGHTKRLEALATARLQVLIDAAEQVFFAKGYHIATMDDVARRAGMSKRTVYALIESKAELFAALLARYQAKMNFPDPQPDWTLHDILCANLSCLAQFLLAPTQIALLRLILTEFTHSPDFGRIFLHHWVVRIQSKLENCLTEIAAQRGISKGNTKELSAILIGMAIGEFHLSALVGFRSPPSRRALEARIHKAVDVFLIGCRTAE